MKPSSAGRGLLRGLRVSAGWPAALLGCAPAPDPVVGPRTGETGDTATVPSCGATALERDEPRCDAAAFSLLAFTTGCADRVSVDLWEEDLRHERHPLDRVTVPDAEVASWSTGALLTGVGHEDWSPGSASAVDCGALGGLTFLVEVEVDGAAAECEAWGPRAAEAGELPGAACVP